MGSDSSELIQLGVVGAIVIVAWKSGLLSNLFSGLKGGMKGGSTSTGGGSGGGVTAAIGKMIYKGTGKVIPGSAIFDDAHQCEAMSSGGCRASTRWLCWGGKGGCGCVPYANLETTMYATYGARAASSKGSARSIITQGGSGQSDSNCCVYSIGFEVDTGKAYAEEEGPHSPHPTISKMGGTLPITIGPLYNRSIGLKSILYHQGGHTYLQGYVDQHANGNWVKFYDAVDPKGGSLPVITHVGMGGSAQPTCQEMRFRTDNVWPVNIDKARSNIAEIAVPVARAASATAANAKAYASFDSSIMDEPVDLGPSVKRIIDEDNEYALIDYEPVPTHHIDTLTNPNEIFDPSVTGYSTDVIAAPSIYSRGRGMFR